MTLMFNAVEFIHRLEKAGLGREAAETIAQAIEQRNAELATKEDIAFVRQDLERYATKDELMAELATALHRQTVQIGAVVGGMIGLATATVSVFVSAG